ncbi:probable RNA-directed DNA polymerase from transposon X-element [Trichonephila clavipes]|nr:probable RNA-directed DNA polymerase from transposon X-element [Trichonephila clavipes]
MHQITLNPIYKTESNRLQAKIKKELKKHSQETWKNRFLSLNTQDNSFWNIQKIFKNKRADIPALHTASGIAITDEQKANLIANTMKDNFTENTRPADFRNSIDSDVTSTLERFFSHPPPTPISPTNPDEVAAYVNKLKIRKTPVNRIYQVRVNNTLSDTHNINIGCPQGSLLGPILFNLYINDMPTHPQTMLNLYADDTCITATFKKPQHNHDCIEQTSFLLEEFFNKWKIKINVDKTVTVLFTRRRKHCTPPTLYSTPLQWSQSTKYLGVILDSKLTWKQHVLHTRNKFRFALRLLFPLVNRNSHMSLENKVLLYTAVLRPILSYASPVWGYAAKSNIKILEVSQNSLIRRITKSTRRLKIPVFTKTTSFKTFIQSLAKILHEH